MPLIFTQIPFDQSRYERGGEQWTHKCFFVGIKPHCACVSRAGCTRDVAEGTQELIFFPGPVSAVGFAHTLPPQKAGSALPGLFICLPEGGVITEGAVECLNCHSCLVWSLPIIPEMCKWKSTRWTKLFGYIMSHFFSSNPQLATFLFWFRWKSWWRVCLFQHHPCAAPWLLSPTADGMERNIAAAGRWGFEFWWKCFSVWVELLKSNFSSGTSYFQITLSLY